MKNCKIVQKHYPSVSSTRTLCNNIDLSNNCKYFVCAYFKVVWVEENEKGVVLSYNNVKKRNKRLKSTGNHLKTFLDHHLRCKWPVK